jgi:hypothetical protein
MKISIYVLFICSFDVFSPGLRIRIRVDSSYFWKLDPDRHYSKKMDVDPQISKD